MTISPNEPPDQARQRTCIPLSQVRSGGAPVVNFNTVAHESLGYTREEFSRLFVTDIQAEHSADQIEENFRRVVVGELTTMETQHRCKDGDLRDVVLTLRPVVMEDNSLISAVWRDVTDQKARERELKATAERLVMQNELIGKEWNNCPKMSNWF